MQFLSSKPAPKSAARDVTVSLTQKTWGTSWTEESLRSPCSPGGGSMAVLKWPYIDHFKSQVNKDNILISTYREQDM